MAKLIKPLASLPGTIEADAIYLVRRGSGFDLYASDDTGTLTFAINPPRITQQIGGRFLLDPNEFNGFGATGFTDDTNSQDLGNVGAAPARASGGLHFPDFAVRLLRFSAWHYNSSASALAWGWRIFRQEKIDNSNTVTSTDLLNEVADNGGAAPRDYLSTGNRRTDITFATPETIPAGEVIGLGVECPTAATTNYYVNVMSGALIFERV